MSSIAVRLLAGLVLLLAAAAGSYWAGDHNRDNAWKAKQAEVVRKAHAIYEAEVKRGDEATTHYLTEMIEKEERYAELEKKFKQLRQRVPLLVAQAATPAAPTVGAEPGPTPEAQGRSERAVDVQPELSVGAVWMWNSALAGADIPANSCGAADTTEQACAAGAGIRIGDAWDNHQANAKSCAADRLRYQALIDFLKDRDAHRATNQ